MYIVEDLEKSKFIAQSLEVIITELKKQSEHICNRYHSYEIEHYVERVDEHLFELFTHGYNVASIRLWVGKLGMLRNDHIFLSLTPYTRGSCNIMINTIKSKGELSLHILFGIGMGETSCVSPQEVARQIWDQFFASALQQSRGIYIS